MNPPNTFGHNSKPNYSAMSHNIKSNTTTSKYFTFKTNIPRLNNIPEINGSMSNGTTRKYSSNTPVKDKSIADTTGTENLKIKQKKNDGSDYRTFIGNAERIIKWNKVYEKFCCYEVISPVISIQEGSVRLQKIMLLKDKKGPILKVVHYINDHINIDDFHVGQMLRCVGRMIGPNTLHAVSIRAAMASEVSNLPRLCCICDHVISNNM